MGGTRKGKSKLKCLLALLVPALLQIGAGGGPLAAQITHTGDVQPTPPHTPPDVFEWDVNGILDVGHSKDGTLSITNGGKVIGHSGYIGKNTSTTGIVTVDGAGSTWASSGDLYVGHDGIGELRISNGGHVSVGGDYRQNGSSLLAMDIGSRGSNPLVVGGEVILNGSLYLSTNGAMNAAYYVLIDNFGDASINGIFSSIYWNGVLVDFTPWDNPLDGGTFEADGVIYTLSYLGESTTGSLFGGSDLILSGGPSVPEPASLGLVGLGIAAMIAKRRK